MPLSSFLTLRTPIPSQGHAEGFLRLVRELSGSAGRGVRGGSMRITDVKCFPIWGGGRNFFFVKVETDEGLYGIGEAGITWRELAITEFVNHLRPLLIGADAARIEHLWQLMFRGGFFPAGKIGC